MASFLNKVLKITFQIHPFQISPGMKLSEPFLARYSQAGGMKWIERMFCLFFLYFFLFLSFCSFSSLLFLSFSFSLFLYSLSFSFSFLSFLCLLYSCLFCFFIPTECLPKEYQSKFLFAAKSNQLFMREKPITFENGKIHQ